MGIRFNLKGQTSIEFLLLLVVMLLYIQAVVLPSVENSTNTAKDAVRLALAKSSTETLANTINQVASSANEAKQTISLHVPEKTMIECSPGNYALWYYVQFEQDFPETAEEIAGVTCNKDPANWGMFSGKLECEQTLLLAGKPCCRKTVPLVSGISLNCNEFQNFISGGMSGSGTLHELSIRKDFGGTTRIGYYG